MEIKAKKSFGQNFLKDEIVLDKIATSFDFEKDDLIIEIGPGKGALTKYLSSYDCDYRGYEIDLRMKSVLEKYESVNNTFIFDDFLNRDLTKDIVEKYKHIYVIANIPYYITTPIIERIMISPVKIDGMTLLVQKEVAERLTAAPGNREYGFFTVYLNYYYDTELLFEVKNTAFDPIPKVDSAVIRLKRKQNKVNVKDEKILLQLLKDAFAMKRKNLRNNLKKYDCLLIETILKKYQMDLSFRAEQISLDIWIELANSLTKE